SCPSCATRVTTRWPSSIKPSSTAGAAFSRRRNPMQSVATALEKVKPSASSASTASTTSASAPLACSEPIPAAWLRRVWERLAAVYPSKWRAAMGESPQADDGKLTVYGDTWAKGLAGLSPEQLGRGLEACITRTDPWPPVLAQ